MTNEKGNFLFLQFNQSLNCVLHSTATSQAQQLAPVACPSYVVLPEQPSIENGLPMPCLRQKHWDKDGCKFTLIEFTGFKSLTSNLKKCVKSAQVKDTVVMFKDDHKVFGLPPFESLVQNPFPLSLNGLFF